MSSNGHHDNGQHHDASTKGTDQVKRGLAQMLKGGVIMDVVNPEQAKIAEDAGACAVMALERVPADIRAQGGVARMSDPDMIEGIMKAVTIPVMAKVRIGHFVEAQILQALGVDYIDESEVLTPADEENHINKHKFTVPFVCGARNLGEALRRINEGAAMIRTKGEAGTGDVVEAVRHARMMMREIRKLQTMDEDELFTFAKEIGAPYGWVKETREAGRLPVVNFGGGAPPPRRCRAHDAVGHGRRVRGQRHFQERRPRQAREGHRRSRHPLRQPRHPGPCEPQPGRSDGGHQRLCHARKREDRHAGVVNPAYMPQAGLQQRMSQPVSGRHPMIAFATVKNGPCQNSLSQKFSASLLIISRLKLNAIASYGFAPITTVFPLARKTKPAIP